ncbi:RluA family pseudouridine synthase [Gluconobacter albidus]|uniref:Pseudouridine synthase n=1 Tax=Gluconobacter albidus TaxID=318683 RepID=A0AAW3QX17_9PROT|nr:RluA family pseudouridine synthase [Gluconobacter albidus]KXV38311.1 pseudouridine synthase [Gluconobacter albidus]MCP1272364.1 RluA family pseudouridine synthase [Gluconobacter albidus]GBQ84156.1 ribosomal RNA large subunit 23S rRNA pseudouridine synthase D [Gluconobacter albidus NBRC 3250]GLQ70350.1 pseudouridine synthase [Gluconobacter albidus]
MSDPASPFRLVVDASTAGQRADRALADAIGTVSRSRVKALIESGSLSVNGKTVCEPAETLRDGMDLLLTFPAPTPARPIAEQIPLTILYEDDDLIVLDKQAGLVTHPAPGNETGTLVNALLGHCGEGFEGIGGEKRPGIVHRLDKDTSGLMVVAKTAMVHNALSEAFAARDIDRAYLALAWGLLPSEGEFDGNIGRDKRDRKRMAVVGSGGKVALTRFRLIEPYQAAVSLIECRLATGRTHQIRVHLSNAGHPLLGDPVYLRRIPGAARGLSQDAKDAALDFSRQALHATRLGFIHPRTKKQLSFETAPPEDFQALKKRLIG